MSKIFEHMLSKAAKVAAVGVSGFSTKLERILDPHRDIDEMLADIKYQLVDVFHRENGINTQLEYNLQNLHMSDDIIYEAFLERYKMLDSSVFDFEKAGSLAHFMSGLTTQNFERSGTWIAPSTDKAYNNMMAEAGQKFMGIRTCVSELLDKCEVILASNLDRKKTEDYKHLEDFGSRLKHILDNTLSERSLGKFEKYKASAPSADSQVAL